MSQWLTPIIVAFITAFGAYLVAIRKLSGRIGTSEAAQLWAEAKDMRAEYRKRAEECENQLKALRNEIATVIARNTALRRENSQLRQELKGGSK